MAAEYYLKIDGPQGGGPKIIGESMTMKDALEIATFDWTVAQEGTSASNSGATGGKAKLNPFKFTIPTNNASPTLMVACAMGCVYDSAKLTCRKAGGTQQIYLEVEFLALILSSYNTNGPGGDAANPMDTVEFDYSAIQITYHLQDTKTGQTKKGETGKWSQKLNAAKFAI